MSDSKICETCGTVFYKKPRHVKDPNKWLRARFCSPTCSRKSHAKFALKG